MREVNMSSLLIHVSVLLANYLVKSLSEVTKVAIVGSLTKLCQ